MLAPNEVHLGRLPRLPFTIFEGNAGHKSLVTPPTATWRPTAISARRISSANTMPSQCLPWNTETRPSPTHCARFPNSPLAAGRGCTIRLPPFSRARKRTRTPRSPRSSSRSIERAPTQSSQLAPVLPLTPRTAPFSALSSYVWIYPPTFSARMLAGAFRYNAASPVPNPTTVAKCRSVCQRA